jgi:hypothetical protein
VVVQLAAGSRPPEFSALENVELGEELGPRLVGALGRVDV